jgi:hypothetical protein
MANAQSYNNYINTSIHYVYVLIVVSYNIQFELEARKLRANQSKEKECC